MEFYRGDWIDSCLETFLAYEDYEFCEWHERLDAGEDHYSMVDEQVNDFFEDE